MLFKVSCSSCYSPTAQQRGATRENDEWELSREKQESKSSSQAFVLTSLFSATIEEIIFLFLERRSCETTAKHSNNNSSSSSSANISYTNSTALPFLTIRIVVQITIASSSLSISFFNRSDRQSGKKLINPIVPSRAYRVPTFRRFYAFAVVFFCYAHSKSRVRNLSQNRCLGSCPTCLPSASSSCNSTSTRIPSRVKYSRWRTTHSILNPPAKSCLQPLTTIATVVTA